MCDQWMPVLRLPMTREQFYQLPRNASYRYEYLDNYALLTPRARAYHARLRLDHFTVSEDLVPIQDFGLRPLQEKDLAELEPVFASAFQGHQPFAGLNHDRLLVAAHECLERTRKGGDGPLIWPASYVALDNRPLLNGAILITLLPEGDPTDFDSYHWREPPPPDAVERRLGRPHLTWVFVHGRSARFGIGTSLLAAAVNALRYLGFTELYTTFLLGNEASMTWHWRHGFQLLSYPGSFRRMKRQWGLKY